MWLQRPKKKETLHNKNAFDMYVCLLSLAHVPSINMEEARFMTFTVTSHQGVIKALWLNFRGAGMSTIFIYSLWSGLASGNSIQSLIHPSSRGSISLLDISEIMTHSLRHRSNVLTWSSSHYGSLKPVIWTLIQATSWIHNKLQLPWQNSRCGTASPYSITTI